MGDVVGVRLHDRLLVGFLVGLLSSPQNDRRFTRFCRQYDIWSGLQSLMTDLELVLFLEISLLLLVRAVPDTSEDDDYNNSDGCAYCCGYQYAAVDCVVVVAVVVFWVAVAVPLGTVSVVVAALPGAVLKSAVLVKPHVV